MHEAVIRLPRASYFSFFYTPKGIRIPVASVKGRCPRPLDDGGLVCLTFTNLANIFGFVKTFTKLIGKFGETHFTETFLFTVELR